MSIPGTSQLSPLQRRNFIRNTGLATGSLLFFNKHLFAIHAKTLQHATILHNIPAEKDLDPAWIRSLYTKGQPTTYTKTKNELKYIGMPASGLHTGTVYLGGDGRLWLWGIYNDDREGIDPKTVTWNDGQTDRKISSRDGSAYIEPALSNNKRVLEQGIALRFSWNGNTVVKRLHEDDWEEIEFEATYPLASVTYIDTDYPFSIRLIAGPVFIPGNTEDSSLPATVQHVEIINHSGAPTDVAIMAWMENGSGKFSKSGIKKYDIFESDHCTAIIGSFEGGAADSRDQGSIALALMQEGGTRNTAFNDWPEIAAASFDKSRESASTVVAPGKQVGSVTARRKLGADQKVEVSFMIAWHFNHPLKKLMGKMPEVKEGYYYAKKFADAGAVIKYASPKFASLFEMTRRWQTTWYKSTLPHWFLERTILNVGTIATANTYRFASGRFWGWEGVNACEGTCTHVWQYAQALARLFPDLERDTRERVDLGIALQADGGILFRGEFESRPAIDGQAGTILRFYREHQLSRDDQFLKRNWQNIKRAVHFMLLQDKNGDGMTDTPMENTLDAVWDGEIAWIVGLCIAAANAAMLMAEEVGDTEFALRCRNYVRKGAENMSTQLFNGEYFIHRPDATKGRSGLGSYNTCHIDQVYGQSWAYQVGMGPLWDDHKTKQALKALWKYNFTKDVGPYIATHLGGRPYALAGEGGMIMNTNPYNEEKPYGENVSWQMGYFHECMSGFEHQVAAHFLAEGMTDEGLVLTRMIHDRYHGSKRNPYNEIECSDHYARSMASYGTFITACGFTYHGPKGKIGFNPVIQPDDFSAAFTAAEGWGFYRQSRSAAAFNAQYELISGKLLVTEILVAPGGSEAGKSLKVFLNDQPLKASGNNLVAYTQILLGEPVVMTAGDKVKIDLGA